MASVFAAIDTELKREVAVKVMYPHLARRQEGAARFKREARAAASLDHPHILRVLDVGGGDVVDGVLESPHIVLELIDGQTLEEFLADRPCPLAEVIAATGAALCSALALAHDKGIIHRDIKPANVMTTKEGRLVLADFGVARVSEEDSVVTRTGTLIGTPAFMSPEQAQGDPVDPRSDLYSVGATLYTLATGSLPYEGSAAQVVSAIIDGKRVPADRRNPQVGRELSRLIDKLMSLEPDSRFDSATDVQEALLQITRDGGFEDPETLLSSYFASPDEFHEERLQTIVSATLKRGNAALDAGRTASALSLAERLLALAPENEQVQQLRLRIGKQTNTRMWIVWAVALGFVGGAGVLLWPEGSNQAIITGTDAGQFKVDVPSLVTDAAFDLVIESIADSGVTVAAVVDAQAKFTSRKPHRLGDARQATRLDAAIEFDASAVLVSTEPAYLIVNVGPWCDVSVDGRELGRASPSKKHQVSPGTHKVVCLQPGTGNQWQQTVELQPGDSKTLTGSVLRGEISVTLKLSTGDAVRVAKRVFRNGQTVKLPVDRYRIEILRDGVAISEAKYLTLRKNCELRDKPSLACFGQ